MKKSQSVKPSTSGPRAYAPKLLRGRPSRTLEKRIIWTLLSVLIVGPGILILFFPGTAVTSALILVSLPGDLPLGIRREHQLESNFREKRPVLEDVVATLRADDLTTARRGYWGLFGYTRPEPRGAEYRQLYRSMRQARIQRVAITSLEPFIVQLVTDEVILMGVTDVYGYEYTEVDDSDAQNFFSPRNRLDQKWYLFDEELYLVLPRPLARLR